MITRRILAAGLGAGCLLPVSVLAEEPSANIWDDPRGRYLPLLVQARRQAEGKSERSGERTVLAGILAMVGDEKGALETGPKSRLRGPVPELASARAEPALAAITAAARDKRIVILNEAHHRSAHRMFSTQVMRALHPLGFRVFAAETFTPEEPTLRTWRPGRPLLPRIGYYVRDPVFAELVREAGALGYRFSDYEARPDQSAAPDAPLDERLAAREEGEALNLIANVLARDPRARVLVHCGYDHAAEFPSAENRRWFAARLKAKTGLDPLTVSQAYGSPAADPADDGSVLSAVLARFQPKSPIVVRSAAGESVSPGASANGMDLYVFHPRLPDVLGRPGWLAGDRQRRPHAVRLSGRSLAGEEVLVQAIPAAEPDPALPADQVLLAPGAVEAVLLLRPGRYRVRAETHAGLIDLGTARV